MANADKQPMPVVGRTDDLRISAVRALIAPQLLLEELPVDAASLATVTNARQAVHRVLHGADDRLVAVVGPCSIHDSGAALEYAARLREAARRHAGDLFHHDARRFKPHDGGWKGLINIRASTAASRSTGLRLARKLLLGSIAWACRAGPVLDLLSPQYISDLIAWGASARAPPNPRPIGSSPRDCRARWGSRTARTDRSASRSMRCARPPRPTRSWE
jgi:3-deoxy-7-phosphoheptulonate synthase